MGIIIFKPKYTPLPPEDSINANSVSYKDGVHMVTYTDTPVRYPQMSTPSKEDRYAVAGDVV